MRSFFGYLMVLLIAGVISSNTHAQVPNPKLFVGIEVFFVSSDATKFGGCKAKFNVDFGADPDIGVDSGGPCDREELSFGCDGTQGVTKAAGNQMYSSAQLAFAMGKQVNVRVNPAYVVNGICVASRVDVTANDATGF